MLSFLKLIKYSRDFFLLGIKHLQIPPNVFVQLRARVNVTVALWTAQNIVAFLNNPFILKSNLYTLTIFLYLKSFLLLKMQLLWMILLPSLDRFTLMNSNIIIFLQTLLRQFRT